MASYKKQDFGNWVQQNQTDGSLESLEEQLKIVNVYLQCAILYPNSFSEEKINGFKNQKRNLLVAINNKGWIKVAYQQTNNKKK